MVDLLERKRVRDSVKACSRCDLRGRCDSPTPFSGPSDAKLVVVGEAPSEEGEPFAGKSSDLLHSWLRRWGWKADQEVAFVNAVSCFPNRTATKDEVNACQTNLVEQLAHLDCGVLLVLGGVAVKALRNAEIRIGEVRGLPWRVDRIALPRPTWAIATWHPTAVLRNTDLALEARTDVHFLTLLARDPDTDFSQFRGEFCVKCDDPEVDFFADIPYCARHLPK